MKSLNLSFFLFASIHSHGQKELENNYKTLIDSCLSKIDSSHIMVSINYSNCSKVNSTLMNMLIDSLKKNKKIEIYSREYSNVNHYKNIDKQKKGVIIRFYFEMNYCMIESNHNKFDWETGQFYYMRDLDDYSYCWSYKDKVEACK